MDTILRKVRVLFCSKWSTGGSQDFPHSYSSSSYKLLRSLISPQKPGDKTLDELITVLQRHHSPTPSEIVQRYRFNTCYRQQAETIATFVSELRSIAEFCNYGESLNDMLRDRLVCGINDSAIQR